MNRSFKGGEVAFILHKSIKLCGHDNHWNIRPHRRKRHDAVGKQVFLKGSEISGSADKIRDHAENQNIPVTNSKIAAITPRMERAPFFGIFAT